MSDSDGLSKWTEFVDNAVLLAIQALYIKLSRTH
jgi:hypothetical protein